MKLSHLMLPLFTVGALVVTSAGAHAQTGPVGGGGGGAPEKTQPAPAQSQMTPDRLLSFLQQKGFKAEIKAFNNGGKIVYTTIEKDGWRYNVEFEFSPDQKSLIISSPLVSTQNMSADQMLTLLKKNHDIYPFGFSVRNDGKLCLNSWALLTANLSEQFLESAVNQHTAKVRDTFDTWKGIQ